MYGIYNMIVFFIIGLIGMFNAKDVYWVWIWWGICIFGVLDGIIMANLNSHPFSPIMMSIDTLLVIIIGIVVAVILKCLKK